LLLRAKALRTHFVLFARNSIRYAHVLLLYCPRSLCSLLIVYRYTHVRYAHYSLHYCLTLVYVRCTHILVLDTRAQAQSRVYVCDGPKGPKGVKNIPL
jgi:hypothetical protein